LLTNLDFFAEIIGYSMIGLPRIFWMFFMGTPLEPFRAGMIARIFITVLTKWINNNNSTHHQKISLVYKLI
jgi:hypothetical protein